jgi:hypothetical protein
MPHEVVGNLHVHTCFSDGAATHLQVAAAALRAGLDFVVTTDHNVWVDGVDGYYHAESGRVLLLAGEEIHHPTRHPQKNHMLVFEARQELAHLAPDPQALIDAAARAGGLTYLAHPTDPAAPSIHQPDLSWVDWDIDGFTGLELWNYMSEFKTRIRSRAHAVYYAYQPHRTALGPHPDTLALWDRLLQRGRRVVAIGGADAHALPARLGPLRRTVLPYELLFRSVNTHVLLPRPFTGESGADRQELMRALGAGACFVANDRWAPARGFHFTAQGRDETAGMGESIRCRLGVTLQIRAPQRAELCLVRDGTLEGTWTDSEVGVRKATTPGAYRAEVYLETHGRRRGWIFSNPIFVTD